MNDKQLKLWHLVITVAVQLVVASLWAGSMTSDVRMHEKRLNAVENDVKRIDSDGAFVWKNSLRFTDKEAAQVQRDLETVKAEMASQRQILIRIEEQLKQ